MSGATTGKVAINDSPIKMLQNQRVGRFVITNIHLRQYLFHYLKVQAKNNLEKAFGAAQPNLSTEQILNIIVPLPPLPAQEKIVEKLNLLATKYKQSKEGMTVKIAKLKQLKASILDTAFRGQL